eukprot:9771978-Heterocapsa_arctica.AAC.1
MVGGANLYFVPLGQCGAVLGRGPVHRTKLVVRMLDEDAAGSINPCRGPVLNGPSGGTQDEIVAFE